MDVGESYVGRVRSRRVVGRTTVTVEIIIVVRGRAPLGTLLLAFPRPGHSALFHRHMKGLASAATLNVGEPAMAQGSSGRHALLGVVLQEAHDQVDSSRRKFRQQLHNAGALVLWEVHVRVGSANFELLKHGLRRGAEYFVDLLDLVHLIGTREQGEQRGHLEHDTADAPHVHFVAVVPVGEQALGRSVPPRGDVFCVRLSRVDTAARPEVGNLELLA
mmetsp:Transcript_35287/g.51848  ORF Transcript_35287/g.51848 Transcript_35287/m.51848 type:complete len:218 (+) Transcript_35287:610-1263(+)